MRGVRRDLNIPLYSIVHTLDELGTATNDTFPLETDDLIICFNLSLVIRRTISCTSDCLAEGLVVKLYSLPR